MARFVFPSLVLRHAIIAASQGRPYHLINVHEPSGAAIALCKRAAGSPRVVVTSHGLEQRGWERSLEEGRLGRGGPSAFSRLAYPSTVLWQARLAPPHAQHVFCLDLVVHPYL